MGDEVPHEQANGRSEQAVRRSGGQHQFSRQKRTEVRTSNDPEFSQKLDRQRSRLELDVRLIRIGLFQRHPVGVRDGVKLSKTAGR
jgi:hypothetical protein